RKRAVLGQSRQAALVSARRGSARASDRFSRASNRQVRRWQDAAAADRHQAVWQGRSGLSGLERNVAAAAQIRGEILPPILVAAYLSSRHEPRPGGGKTFRRSNRSTAVSGRGQSYSDSRSV